LRRSRSQIICAALMPRPLLRQIPGARDRFPNGPAQDSS
jgi:hypothetical protein